MNFNLYYIDPAAVCPKCGGRNSRTPLRNCKKAQKISGRLFS